MRIASVGGKIFTWNGHYIRERKTNRVYDPKTGEVFLSDGEKRLPLNAYGDFGIDPDVAAVAQWKRDATTAYNIMRVPEFMHIDVI